jgi:hypothetical protein
MRIVASTKTMLPMLLFNAIFGNMRALTFVFQEPGMIEAIASEPEDEAARSIGYANSMIPDLLTDRDAESLRPCAWMCYNFERTYPLVIWGLKLFADEERFDVPQAGLSDVPLHTAFGWVYHHFILQDGALLSENVLSSKITPHDYARIALGHALATVE